MEFSVFYAWQSDRPNNLGRGFIRKALDAAVNRINADTTVEDSLRPDQDTEDVAGTPEIANTIFQKIDRCGVFLADLTYVGTTGSAEENAVAKRLPNSNVLIELGYAAKAVGWERIILVFNEAFGDPSQLPFDLKHRRWPITYKLDERGTDKARVRKELSVNIERALRAVVSSGALTPTESRSGDTNGTNSGMLEAFRAERIEALVGAQTPVLLGLGPKILLHIIPTGVWKQSADAVAPTQAENAAMKFVPISKHLTNWRPNFDGLVCYDAAEGPEEMGGYVQVFRNGVIESVDAALINYNEDEMIRLVPCERYILDASRSYLDGLSQLGIEGPFSLLLTLIGAEGYHLDFDVFRTIRKLPQPLDRDPLPLPACTLQSAADSIDKALRPAFDAVWQAFGESESPCYNNEGRWIGIT